MAAQRDSQASFTAATLQSLPEAMGRYGDHDAIVFFDKGHEEHWTYAQLADDAARLANGLAAEGVGRGDRIALCGRNRPEWVAACLGILRSGAAPVLVDTQVGDDTLRHILRNSDARYLFTTAGDIGRLRESCKEAGVEILLLDDAADAAERSWRSLLPEADPTDDIPPVREDDMAALFYTSGTTGPPKGVPLSHRNLVSQIRTLIEAELVSGEDRVLLPLPLHHVYPFIVGTLTPLAIGLPLVIPSAFTGPQILDALQRGRASLIIGVPRLYEAMVAGLHDRLGRQGRLARSLFRGLLAFSIALRRRTGWRLGAIALQPLRRRIAADLRMVVSGGAALKPEVGWQLEGLGWLVATGYGLTETSALLTINRPGNRRFDTAGHPVPGVELRIDGGAAPPGKSEAEGVTTGEVLAKGPGVFAGYLDLPEQTAEALTEGGWFRTGDLGFIDDAGDLHLVGRRSTVIVVESGENVQPDAVEDAYQQNPAIGEIAVLGHNGRLAGLIVPSARVLEAGNADDAIRRAVDEVSRTLPSHHRLAEFALTREAIPRTRLGKPRRHLLAERYEQAWHGDAGAAPQPKGPMPLEEMSAEDRALLEDPAAAAAWEVLAGRFADRRLSPDSDLGIDLGIDSMGWLDLSLELAQRSGVEVGESIIAKVRTVRDLLTEIASAATGGSAQAPWYEEPDAVLSEAQKRWLQPLGPLAQGFAFCLYWLNRGLMRLLFRTRCHGIEHLPDNLPYLLAPNHTSFLDPLVLAASLDYRLLRRIYWAGWTGVVFTSALRRAAARLAQVVPIDPRQGAAASLAFGAAILQRENALVWFPEGARSEDGTLQPFMPGIGMLLEHCPVPVMPVVIDGAYAAWPRQRALPRLAPVTVTIHHPVDPRQLDERGSGKTAPQRIADALHHHLAGLIG
ncbi:MAG: AMP-binding protein [Rhodospirillales bacterium]